MLVGSTPCSFVPLPLGPRPQVYTRPVVPSVQRLFTEQLGGQADASMGFEQPDWSVKQGTDHLRVSCRPVGACPVVA